MEETNETKTEVNGSEVTTKKDFHPIWMYFVGQLGVGFIIGIILGIKGLDLQNETVHAKANAFIIIFSFLLLSIIFFCKYKNKVKEDAKKLSKRKVGFILLISVVLVSVNILVSYIFEQYQVATENQDMLMQATQQYKIPLFFVLVFLAPFVEEVVTRYSVRTLFSNKIIFVIVSTIFFGLIHGAGIATLLYMFLGASYAIIYERNDDNLVASLIPHIINNFIASISILFL